MSPETFVLVSLQAGTHLQPRSTWFALLFYSLPTSPVAISLTIHAQAAHPFSLFTPHAAAAAANTCLQAGPQCSLISCRCGLATELRLSENSSQGGRWVSSALLEVLRNLNTN
jgi:hypothetical protein